MNKYCGTWSFTDTSQTHHELTIHSDYSFWLDDRSLGTLLVEVTSEKLIVRDQYGFYLTFSYNDMLLYDEANDSAYLLSKNHDYPSLVDDTLPITSLTYFFL
ncbi:DUF4828 domain-containing protein [Enterococcus mundtii]|nr:DUF4828 domain-containing protein [Enterococcus mundtii]